MAREKKKINIETEPELVEKKIINFISKQTQNVSGIVVGLSGGIDSALCAYLCTTALGRKKTFGLILPSASTNTEDIKDAKTTADILGIKYRIIEIDKIFREINKKSFSKDKIGLGNIAARIRMILLRDFAHKNNLIVCGTGNKSELEIGYFTKNGDGGVDILPIGGLYKTQVRILAKYMGIKSNILKKPPSANLWKNQRDEEEIGLSYELLDKVLFSLEKGIEKKRISKMLRIEEKTIDNILKRIEKNRHKINSIPVLEI